MTGHSGYHAAARALSVLLFLGTFAQGGSPLGAQEAPIARATSTAAPPQVDGVLDDPAWAAATALEGFVQREPFEGRPASEATEARILFDDEALYVGAWLYDSDPEGIVYGETRRDADPGNTDAVVLVLDTYKDRQNGFLFATTPAGIEYDGQITREGQGGGGGARGRRQQRGSGGGFNVNWDGSWEVATSRDRQGWYAEFRIPFSTLRYGSGREQEWGLNVVRRIRRKNEEAYWSPVSRQFDLYRVSSAGTLRGLEPPVRRTFTVTPYVLSSARRDYSDLTREPETDTDWEVGGDAKLLLSSDLTLDVTANTDFAQVEVDDEQVNLTRFNLFFPEKRPFFLENAGTFSVGSPQEVELFFSRSIGIVDERSVPIVAGGRMTGKIAGLTVGLLDVQTDDVKGVVGPNNYAVGRVMKELANRTRLGAMAVSRVNTDDGDDRNLAVAVDGRLGLGEFLTFDGYLAGTDDPGAGDDETAYSFGASWNSRDWQVGGTMRRVGAGFDPQAGFVPRGGHRMNTFRILRRYRFDGVSWFRELRPHVSYREFFTLGGFSETRVWHIDSHFEFANGAFFQLPALNLTSEGLQEPFEISPGVVLPPGTYQNVDWGFSYNTDLSAPLSVQGRVDVGGFYNGFRYGTASTLNARVGDTFVASLRVSWFDVDLDQGDFETSVIGLRAAYSFSPRLYVQSLLQYNDQSDSFSSNVRVGWLNTAGTGLFIVFNDLEHTGSLERTGIPRGPVDRTLVVKFTKLFNLGG